MAVCAGRIEIIYEGEIYTNSREIKVPKSEETREFYRVLEEFYREKYLRKCSGTGK